MNIKGKLVEIFDEQQVTGSFKKREFVVEFAENPQYPEFIKFELIQDKCGLLNSYQVDQEIEIHFNLKGRKWNDPNGGVKYFNTLQAWRLTTPGQKVTQNNGPGQAEVQTQATTSNEPPAWLDNADDEDVPF
ncbi:MAG: DUF3127 domain-containing protein [Deltaproteobacteria bacterium]|jgi:hypothetical protein|nr:DUF3127 domain-containing protein [Deltaproteobacteria bacterium]